MIDRIFNQQWIKNVEYCPQLAPVERGFSLVWSYVRRRWLETQRNPLQVLRDSFDYYSVHRRRDGAAACYNLFNLSISKIQTYEIDIMIIMIIIVDDIPKLFI